MSLNYNEELPSTAYLRREIYQPEIWLEKYVVISSEIRAFRELVLPHYNEHYKIFPYTKVVGLPVRGNRTTNFFIVMDKSWWLYVEHFYGGDLNKYYEALVSRKNQTKK